MMEVKPTTLEHIRVLFNSPEEVYRLTSPRGRVLIFHNDEFDEAANPDQDSLDDRLGSEFDLSNLEQMFEALDFSVIPHSNLSSQRLLDSIKEETKHPDHEKYGMFIMVLLSHGDEGVIYGSDARKVSINDITRRLSVKNFPAMADKPKMVIIQACAGGENDNTVYELLDDHPEKEVPGLPTQPRVIKSTVSDFIIMQASYPGFKSFRDSQYGTLMIQAFINVMKEYSCHYNVHELVVKVRNAVLAKCGEFADKNIGAQTVHSSETLRKKLYFFPGMSTADSMESTCPRSVKSVSAAKPSSVQQSGTRPKELPQAQSCKHKRLIQRAGARRINLSADDRVLRFKGISAPPSTQAEASFSNLPQGPAAVRPAAPPSAQAAGSPSPPLVSAPASSSNSSVKLTSLKKLRHLKSISTPNECYAVALDADSQVFHGGIRYDSLNGTRYGVYIECIQAARDKQLIMLESNRKDKTTDIVTYNLGKKLTTAQKLLTYIPSYTAYERIYKMQIQYCGGYITHFTKINDLLVQTGGDSGKLYFYKYSTGYLTQEVTHPDMKHPWGICHDTNKNIYVTDISSNSIYKVALNNDESSSIAKMNCEIVDPRGIASHDGLLVVLSNVEPIRKLHIITTRGEKVTTINVNALPECKGLYVLNIFNLSIDTRGVVAISTGQSGVQLYKFE